eukprot:CAMPEP_0174732462 /NCGR_PEP_ID=MMETSP1094-20130205/59459_1 /TAXON_ID=156173 /ORGANISM="Chrysochromulina brevifilum, Strain UTEX LB 985" /LENGTH=177 /DNA_ID=CAMNT_0015934981 /DNA_START=73 /DNA_END=606 /DNA_ORIENTATION=-
MSDDTAAAFLRQVGEEDRRINIMLERHGDVAFWRDLHEKFADVGGNVQQDGIRVRTPWAGPPPKYWSTLSAAVAWTKANASAEHLTAWEEEAAKCRDEFERLANGSSSLNWKGLCSAVRACYGDIMGEEEIMDVFETYGDTDGEKIELLGFLNAFEHRYWVHAYRSSTPLDESDGEY